MILVPLCMCEVFILPPDINKCLTIYSVCNVNADCTNTPESFECICRPGFEGGSLQRYIQLFVFNVFVEKTAVVILPAF